MRSATKFRAPLERDVQRAVVTFYRATGCTVYSTAQGYRHDRGGTRCTPGIPDLIVFYAPPHHLTGGFLASMWYHEVKRPGAKQNAAQTHFARVARGCGIDVVVGGVQAAVDRMRKLKFPVFQATGK